MFSKQLIFTARLLPAEGRLKSNCMKRLLTLIGIVFLLLSFGTYHSPFGLTMAEPIAPYLNGAFPDISPSAGDWEVENAFPNLTFPDPIGMQELPDQSGFFVAGKQGYIWLISNDPSTIEKKEVLNISDLVITGEDAGLINFILHPEFDFDQSLSKGYAYVYYPFHPIFEDGNQPRINRLSRFTYDFDLQQFDPQSEFILIQDYDPQGYHMGGGMFFDNQGFLNFTIGDGGSTADGLFEETMQQIDKYLMGGLFRIDVDKNPNTSHPIRKQPETYPGKPSDLPETFTQGYFIPNDNPWQDENGGILEEFYGLGLRSPHRASYDPFEEKIWIGDVGAGAREEITILPKGGNAQWPFMEGNYKRDNARPQNLIGIETPPKFDYERSNGVAVIGGFVYRGDKWSHVLDGYYLFADHSNGNIWSLNPVTDEVVLLANVPKTGVGSKRGIGSFATDANGEIYVLNMYGKNMEGGTIQRLKLNQVAPAYIPVTLSETGAFKDLNTLETVDGIIPYGTNSPLWSDGASKRRWLSIPNDGSYNTPEEQVVFSEFENWQFPPGSVFIKHFELPIDERNPDLTRRLETRFYIIDQNLEAYGLTYKWNEAGTDAELLNTEVIASYPVIKADGSTEMQTWNYPNRLQCNSCHTPNAGFVLGVNTAQLNGNFSYPNGNTANQLVTLEHLGIFANSINIDAIGDLPKAAPIDDESVSEEHRVMSYLDANCAHCHRPNGVEGVFDARLSTPLIYKNLIQQFGVSHNTPFGQKMIVPKDHEASQIWIRDNSIEENKMPPIAKNIVDEKYIEVLERWINNLDESKIGPCEIKYISEFDWAYPPTNGWGPMEKDRSNGNENLLDGATLSINGETFSRGIGSHAESQVTFKLNCAYELFSASIGIHDDACEKGSAIFEIWGDGKKLFASEIMRAGEKAKFISVDISYVHELTLKTLPTEDGQDCDHTNWGDAKVQRCSQTGLTEITRAFAFGANDYTTQSANAPDVIYTKGDSKRRTTFVYR